MAPMNASCAPLGPRTSGGTPYLRVHLAQIRSPQSQAPVPRPDTDPPTTRRQPPTTGLGDRDPMIRRRAAQGGEFVGVVRGLRSNPSRKIAGLLRSTVCYRSLTA